MGSGAEALRPAATDPARRRLDRVGLGWRLLDRNRLLDRSVLLDRHKLVPLCAHAEVSETRFLEERIVKRPVRPAADETPPADVGRPAIRSVRPRVILRFAPGLLAAVGGVLLERLGWRHGAVLDPLHRCAGRER